MVISQIVSIKERKIFLTTIILVFSFVICGGLSTVIDEHNRETSFVQSLKSEGLYNEANYSGLKFCTFGRPFYDFWSRFYAIICLPLAFLAVSSKKKRFFVSFLLLLFPIASLGLWFLGTQQGRYYAEVPREGVNNLFLVDSTNFDLLGFGLLLILFVWNTSILFRIFCQSWKNKNALP